ncbi:MAG: DNA-directed RNA polymerase subunit omega [Candidatus Aminicenantes bacterium]|nr:MAG: DNA-directed RNA polymerase subunit omega [Candidatus Aminicenantes bacterium]
MCHFVAKIRIALTSFSFLTSWVFSYIINTCKEAIVEKLDFIDSKFRLAILAAKRSKQLVAGAKKRVDTTAENPLTIAMEEIFQGKIKYKILEEHELEMNREESAALMLENNEEENDYNVEEFLYKDEDDTEDNNEEAL